MKKQEGVERVSISAMRTLMQLYPGHASPMRLALLERINLISP